MIIGLGTYLARQYPTTAGFIVGAIPLSTALTLAMTQLQYGDTAKTLLIARSVFVAIILSSVFFIPYFVGMWFRVNFWVLYISSLILVLATFPLHQKIMSLIK